MDTQNLKTFLLLSQIKNFTQTAEQQFVAQSTVTNRIMELEKELGKKLFLRERNNLSLTKDGELFLEYAKRIVELEETAIHEFNTQNAFRAALRVGTANTVYECHLYEPIRSFFINHPDVSIKVTIDHSFTLIQMLQDQIIDLAFTYVPVNKKYFKCSSFRTDELVLVTHPKNQKYANGISKEQLVSTDYLYCNFALQDVGIYIRELFPKHHHFRFEIDKSTTLLQYLLNGIGFSFLPKSLINHHIENGQLIMIPLLDFDTPKINSYILQKENVGNASVIEDFIESIRLD
ncbi:LysR family transcriptional regulator [Lachnoclostridium sp.]|uniref:LysR family transcriptional regulator n=1 Tax=Lachnoclostridium sp. TaxID=2028282 RepID=UPI0028A29A1D|nr:LysR family transcriptional regulator [Lachnoclostridium sp.]